MAGSPTSHRGGRSRPRAISSSSPRRRPRSEVGLDSMLVEAVGEAVADGYVYYVNGNAIERIAVD